MMYVMLLAVAIIGIFFYSLPEYRSRMSVTVISMLLSLCLAYFTFMLYVCKVSFNLSLFQRYFPIARDIIMFLYAFPLDRQAVLSLLNLFCVLFLFSNLWLSHTFWPRRVLGHRRAIFIGAGILYALQLALYDPNFYIGLYTAVYPNLMTRSAIDGFYTGFQAVTRGLNVAVLAACVSSVAYGYITAPPLKVMRTTLGLFLLAYSTLVVTYLTFFISLPRLMIDYSEKAGIVTYQLLFFGNSIPFYGMYPYILTALVLLLIYTAYRLTTLRRKLDTQNLSIAKTIEAANMPARIFCHFMKNEVLSLSAELEEMIAEKGDGQTAESMEKHLKWLYTRLDDIHRNMREDVMQMQQVPLDKVILRSAEALKASNALNGITLQLHFPSEIPIGFIDPQYMQQALINLLQNACEAVKAVNDEREMIISIGLYPQLRWTLIQISDNGCGIPEADLTNIFSPFFSTKPMTQSWGIGLSLAHRIIASMGGHIDVESKVEKGTSFHILLPSMIRSER